MIGLFILKLLKPSVRPETEVRYGGRDERGRFLENRSPETRMESGRTRYSYL